MLIILADVLKRITVNQGRDVLTRRKPLQ
jgi:hypothetical protein